MDRFTQSVTRMRFSAAAANIHSAKKIGVALGPGLPYGLVGLGLLVALEQLGIPISMISGTSMGALMGALYASGLTTEAIHQHTRGFFADDKLAKLLRENKQKPYLGLSSGEKLMEEIRKAAGWDPEFYDLKLPLFVVAADKVSQKSVILRHGKVFDAVRASIAMPMLLEEVQIGGMQLADGAIFAPLDTETLYAEGADFVIAIHAKPIRSERIRELTRRSKLEPYLLRLLGWKTDPEIYFSKPACDILLRPRVPQALAAKGNRVDEIIQLGAKITYEALYKIEKDS